PKERERLQDIVWPRMKEMMRGRLDELRADGTQIAVIEAAVLIDANWQDLTDEIWVVQVPEAIAMQRLMARNGFSAEDAQARIRAQLSNDERAQHADVIVENSGTIEDARRQVEMALAAV
ncbi:MAG: dephospho-CoA kinase, partial [Dehalococcoidia bacterium]